jgi:hypothetical protein
MAHPPHEPSLPRGVSAVLVGRQRARYWRAADAAPVELRAAVGDFAEGELEGALRALVADKTLRGRVALGFEPEVEFFATERRALLHGKGGTMLEKLVAELGQDMVGREVDTSLPADVFSTAIMVPGLLARQARRGLAKLGPSAVRFVSTTHAVLTAAERAEPKQVKRAEVEIRILTGAGSGMALLAQNGSLLARHVFEFSQAHEFAVISAVRRLLGVARDSLHLATDPELVLHGGEDLLERVVGELGVRGRCAPAMQVDAAGRCAAIAHCAFRRGAHVNLVQAGARALGGEPAALPVGGLLAAFGTLAAVGFWMNLRAGELDAEIRNFDVSSSEVFERFGSDVYELRDQEERLGVAAYLAGRFAQDRVRWAPLLEELPRLLPGGLVLESFEGSYPFWFSPDEPAVAAPADELANNRWCELTATASAMGGDTPPQVQAFTAALRESEAVRACFRRVTGAGVELHEEDAHPWVEARVRCVAR